MCSHFHPFLEIVFRCSKSCTGMETPSERVISFREAEFPQLKRERERERGAIDYFSRDHYLLFLSEISKFFFCRDEEKSIFGSFVVVVVVIAISQQQHFLMIF